MTGPPPEPPAPVPPLPGPPPPSSLPPGPPLRASEHQRLLLLSQLSELLEWPMLVLGLLWLALVAADLIWGLSPPLQTLSTVIWGIFILDFALKFLLAPRKLHFLRHNWLTALSLLLPALRVARLARLLRVARAARGLRLVRVLTSLNRGMRALGGSMGRRGFGYVALLSVLVTLAGAAGMYASEREVGGFSSYGEALWWTAMLLTSLGSEYWPKTSEGRVLCFLLALYGFAVFGYLTATLATYFVGRDAGSAEGELAGQASVDALRGEIAALRAELRPGRATDRMTDRATDRPTGPETFTPAAEQP